MPRPIHPSSHRVQRCRSTSRVTVLWAAVAAWELLLSPGTSLAQPRDGEAPAAPQVPVAVPLRCRVGDGPWLGCAMEVEQPGSRWTLVMGQHRIGFRHDGSGTVRMQDPERKRSSGAHERGWIPVETSWIAGPALCWNGVCAQGDIPLD